MQRKIIKFTNESLISLLLIITPSFLPHIVNFSSEIHAQNLVKNEKKLELNQPIIKEIKDNETHTYQIYLEEGEYLNLIVNQISVDVRLELINPEGKKVEWQSFTATSIELLDIIAEKSGIYTLKIISHQTALYYERFGDKYAEQYPNEGEYEIKIIEKRQAKSEDKEKINKLQIAKKSYLQDINKYLTIENLTEALSIYQEFNYVGMEGLIIHKIGKVYHDLGEWQKAENYYQQALKKEQEIDEKIAEGWILNSLGLVFLEQKQNEKALNYYEQEYKIWQQFPERLEKYQSLLGGSLFKPKYEERDKFKNFYEQSLIIAKQQQNQKLEALILKQLATIYYVDKLEKQVSLYQQSLAIFQEIKDYKEEAETLILLGDSYLSESYIQKSYPDLQTAINFHQQGLKLYQQFAETDEVAQILRILGDKYLNYQQYDQALKFNQELLALYPDNNESEKRAEILLILGNSYRSSPQFEQSIQFYQQSLILYQELGNRKKEAEVLYRIGDAYKYIASYKPELFSQAFDYFHQSLTVYQNINEREKEAEILNKMGEDYCQLRQYDKALIFYQKYIAVLEDLGYFEQQSKALNDLAENYQIHNYLQAIDFYQQFINVNQKLEKQDKIAHALQRIGYFYSRQQQYKEAIEFSEKSLAIYKQLNDQKGQAVVLMNIGLFYLEQKQYKQADKFHQQTLNIYRNLIANEKDVKELESLAETLEFLVEYFDYGSSQSLDFYQLILIIYHKLDDQLTIAKINQIIANLSIQNQSQNTIESKQNLQEQSFQFHQNYIQELYQKNNYNYYQILIEITQLYWKYYFKEEYEKAYYFEQEFLSIIEQLDDKKEKAKALESLGLMYFQTQQYEKALNSYEKTLNIYQNLDDDSQEIKKEIRFILMKLGDANLKLQKYEKAVKLYLESGIIAKELYGRKDEADFLHNSSMISALIEAKQYEIAINFLEQALSIYQELGEKKEEAQVKSSLGYVYEKLNQNQKAITFYQESLAIYQQLNEPTWEAYQLENLGDIYVKIGQDQKALEYHNQFISIYQKIGDKNKEKFAFEEVANVYFEAEKYEQALKFYQQYLALLEIANDPFKQLAKLNSIGKKYQEANQYQIALNLYQQALTLSSQLQQQPQYQSLDLSGEILANIGSLFAQQEETELAIIFYKFAVNSYEKVRNEYVDTELISQADFAQLFLAKHQQDYRDLADLLLKQDRILEAQRVLDLLKIQELDDYLREVRGTENSQQGIPNTPPEKQIKQGVETIIAQAVTISQEYDQLITLKSQGELTQKQVQKLNELVEKRQQIILAFNEFIESKEVENLITQLTPLSRKTDFINQLDNLTNLSDNLQALNQNAVLIYPLILDDRIEIIITTYASPPVRYTVKVSKQQLTKIIAEFRQQLIKPNLYPKINAQKLYKWLIKPLEKDLITVDAKTIIYAPDGILRYIPLSALYDGKQWLIEKYAINHITATSLIDLNTQPQSEINLLAGAYVNVSHKFELGGENFDFQGLPFTEIEVANLAKIIPKTKTVIDRDFNVNLIPTFDAYTVIHLATHAALVIGKPEQSFILFGDGNPVTLTEMKTWNFTNIDLVVLSACETGLGGNFGSGIEILGLGYMIEKAGARASIASLWTVDDGGTEALMNEFYRNLAQRNMTKAQALQQAQISLIKGVQKSENIANLNEEIKNNLSHPYYWSSFILIGNGL